jgi:cell division protein ZapA
MAAEIEKHEKRIFEVTLAGLSLKLKTSHDADTVHQLVSYVDQKVSEALKLTKSGSRENAALLASLNIAEELIILKSRATAEIEKIESKAQKVLADLESSRQQVSGFVEGEVRKNDAPSQEPGVMGIDH